MKNKYEKPEIMVVEMNMQSIVFASGVSSTHEVDGIGWGGIDDAGSLVPE